MMANFNTHIGVAAVASGMLATLCLQVGLVDAKDALLLATIGVIGGILPDIDLHYSYPSRILFSLLGIVCAFLWIFAAENDFPIVYLWAAGLGIYLFVRYPFWSFFQKVTVHRGAIHSILMALFFLFFSVVIGFYLFAKTPFVSWLIGLFMFFGFMIHLVLDEMYSVDFINKKIKRSFGSAFKIYDFNNKAGAFLLIVSIAGLWYLAPPSGQFLDTITSQETYKVILERLY